MTRRLFRAGTALKAVHNTREGVYGVSSEVTSPAVPSDRFVTGAAD
ncbi:hypothetical protein Maes01_00288 [Microbulbifer aestuariivivens]|uniref:Uncharacterized protein n=1 Tax=Microbulbifer aestuariivivens TaxID=1908308 RepID=A0ABP9WKV6_9GAMM